MENNNKTPKARAQRVEKIVGKKSRYEMMQTKVRPETFAHVKRIANIKGISDYTLTQMMFDAIVRYMDDRHNLTPEMEQLMSVFEHMEGWGDAMNHADSSVNRVIGEAIYFIFDGDGKKHGCRAVHVTKPFFGHWSEDMNVQHILGRCFKLLAPEMYRRLNEMAEDMGCSSLYELFIKLIDQHAKDSDAAAIRELFEDAARADNGRALEYGHRTRQTKTKHLNEEPTFFDDLNDEEDDNREDSEFEDQIIEP